MKKFTKAQVLDEVRAVKAGELATHESEVYDTWMDMAGDWLANDDGTYLRGGFEGWNQRSPETILCDFHFSGRLERPLPQNEIDQYHAAYNAGTKIFVSAEEDTFVAKFPGLTFETGLNQCEVLGKFLLMNALKLGVEVVFDDNAKELFDRQMRLNQEKNR